MAEGSVQVELQLKHGDGEESKHQVFADLQRACNQARSEGGARIKEYALTVIYERDGEETEELSRWYSASWTNGNTSWLLGTRMMILALEMIGFERGPRE